MNLQEAMDKMAIHLVTQNECSRDDAGNCTYRGLNNTSCGVGILIPDKEYHKCMEGKISDDLINDGDSKTLIKLSINNRKARGLLSDVQDVHDDIPVDEWISSLLSVYTTYELHKTKFLLYLDTI